MPEEVLACPYCSDKESHHHLYVNYEKSVFYCQLCGAKGTLKQLAVDFPGIVTVTETAQLVRDARKFYALPKRTFFFSPVLGNSSVIAREAYNFLRGRGVTEGEMRHFRPSITSSLMWYVVFPDDHGFDVFWAARSLSDARKPKWLFPRAGETRLTKSEAVWGLSRIAPESEVWMCEGIFDAIAVRGVAFFGKKPSAAQLRKVIATHPRRLVVAFDRDALADAKAVQEITRSLVPTQVLLPELPYKDYGDMLKRGWRRP